MKSKIRIKRDSNIKFRVSAEEKFAIKQKANSANLSVSDYCRKTALNKKFYQILDKTEKEYFGLLKEKYNDFKRVKNHWAVPKNRIQIIDQMLIEIKEVLDLIKL